MTAVYTCERGCLGWGLVLSAGLTTDLKTVPTHAFGWMGREMKALNVFLFNSEKGLEGVLSSVKGMPMS